MAQQEYEDAEDFDMDMPEGEEESLFWSMKIEADKEQVDIDPPKIPGHIIHVTNACFGTEVSNGSRSVLLVQPTEEDESGDLKPADAEPVPVCVLRQSHNESQPLDLLFNSSVLLSVKGTKPSTVYLTGYLQPDADALENEQDMPDFDNMDEEEIQEALRQRRQEMGDAEEEDDEEPEELIDESAPPSKKQKLTQGSKATQNGNGAASTAAATTTKRKSPQLKPKSPAKKQVDIEDKEPEETVEEAPVKEAKADKKKDKDKALKTMTGGIKYRDMKVGDGALIKNGDKVRVYYVGQLKNKKVFDKAISGDGFEFNFGKGDVIKGWDLGLKGMKIGGKRKLVVPAKLGYGSNGSPPLIPPNAELTFTIEIKSVA